MIFFYCLLFTTLFDDLNLHFKFKHHYLSWGTVLHVRVGVCVCALTGTCLRARACACIYMHIWLLYLRVQCVRTCARV